MVCIWWKVRVCESTIAIPSLILTVCGQDAGHVVLVGHAHPLPVVLPSTAVHLHGTHIPDTQQRSTVAVLHSSDGVPSELYRIAALSYTLLFTVPCGTKCYGVCTRLTIRPTRCG